MTEKLSSSSKGVKQKREKVTEDESSVQSVAGVEKSF
jgi:hypothetical protein